MLPWRRLRWRCSWELDGILAGEAGWPGQNHPACPAHPASVLPVESAGLGAVDERFVDGARCVRGNDCTGLRIDGQEHDVAGCSEVGWVVFVVAAVDIALHELHPHRQRGLGPLFISAERLALVVV